MAVMRVATPCGRGRNRPWRHTPWYADGQFYQPDQGGPAVETLTRTDYLNAALALLAEGGANAVTVAGLCSRLGVTKGSFYHHFRGAAEVQAMALTAWEARHGEHAATVQGLTDASARFALLKEQALRSDPALESAIRAWARIDEGAAAVYRRVERARHRQLVDVFTGAGIPAARAQTLARIGFAMLAGMQRLGERSDRAGLRDMLDEYERWLEHVRTEST